MELGPIFQQNFNTISPDYKAFACQKHECRKCSLYEHYNQVTQSEGNAANPTFVFIGEAPGKDEIEQVRPFIGKAGQCLRLELRKHRTTFNKSTTLLTNLLPCRPPNNKFPQKGLGPWRVEESEEYDAKKLVKQCMSRWLIPELRMLRPKVIVTIGSQPLEFLRQEKGITTHHGTWLFLDDYRAWSYALYHPSYVLRCANDPAKQHVVQEFVDDIDVLAKTWQELVLNDPRLEMDELTWKKHRALEWRIKNHLVTPKPLSA